MRTVDDAFQTFALAAKIAGATVALEGSSTEPSRISRLTRDGAELRLSSDSTKQRLSLEISHGPSSGSQAGWLALHSIGCNGEILVAHPELIAEFVDAISYGLELMGLSSQRLPPNTSLERTRDR